MARSHPPTLLTLTARALRDDALVTEGDVVLAAVSGGPDSMALLHVLASLRARFRFTLVAHGVDHGLRPAARDELDRAAAFAASLAVPFDRTELHVAPGGNLQARARDARYEALTAAARRAQATRIATAHHADDRAETFLLRLLRGAGPSGLAVLPPHAGDRIRPFLRASRADIDAHVARHQIPFSSDPSNENPRFARTRVRRELLPLLRELSPGIVDHLCALADQLAASPVDGPPRLPRATRDALVALARDRSQKARVLLPGGLVASFDRTQLRVVVSTDPPRKRRTKGEPAAKPGER